MCEAIWLKRLLQDLWVEVVDSIPIYCDNINRMPLVKKPVFHARTKHILVHYRYVRERFSIGEINLAIVPTQENIAYLFTNLALPRVESVHT